MRKRVIAVTSTSGIDYRSNKHGIRVLPLSLYLMEKPYQEMVEISSDACREWMRQNPDKPVMTSPPNLDTILNFYKTLLDEGYEELILITLSGKVSQTFSFAEYAARLFTADFKVTVFDSYRAGFSESVFAFAAARLAKKGFPTSVILKHLSMMREKSCLFYATDVMGEKVKKESISTAVKLRSSIFKSRPVIGLDMTGDLCLISKTASFEEAVDDVGQRVRYFIGGRNCILFAQMSDEAVFSERFEARIKDKLKVTDLVMRPPSPVLSTHVGHNALAIGAFLR